MFVFQFFAAKIAIPPVNLLSETALYVFFYFFTICNKLQVFCKFEIPQFLSKMCILTFSNNYKLAIPTIPLVSETAHMFVFQLFAAKIAIPPVPLLTVPTL